MKFTNIYNLPEPIVEAVTSRNHAPSETSFAVTRLIDSPLVRKLTIEHWEDLVADVSEYAWSIFGQGVHHVLENYRGSGIITELYLKSHVGDYDVSGIMDMMDITNSKIVDYKSTSTWKMVFKEFDDYIAQLNIYNWLLYKNNMPTMTNLENVLFLKDWSANQSKRDADYPRSPIVTITHPVWPVEKTDSFIKARVKYHSQPAKECTPEEKWQTKTTYAVKVKGQKRAKRVFDNVVEANKELANYSNSYVETRPGENRRCSEYCLVRNVCPFAKRG